MDDATIAAETTPETAANPLVSASAIPADELARLTDDIVSALKTVYDPEIPADIYELGLIYKIDIEDDRSVKIDMTLTAPGCPVAHHCTIPPGASCSVTHVTRICDRSVGSA